MNYEFEGKNEKEAIEKAAAELGLERDEFDVEIIETQKKSLFKAGYVKIRITPVKETNVNSDSGRSYDPENVAKRIVTNPLAQDDFEQKLIDFINEIISKYNSTFNINCYKINNKQNSFNGCTHGV